MFDRSDGRRVSAIRVRGRRRRIAGALIGLAAAIGLLPLAGHTARSATALGDVQFTSNTTAPATVPSGTYFTATFEVKNNSANSTAGPVMLTDRVLDRPPFLPGGTFLAERANGANITSVTTSGAAATCGAAPSDVTGWAASGIPPFEGELLSILAPYELPVSNMFGDIVGARGSPASIPGIVASEAPSAVAAETGNPTPGVPGLPTPNGPAPTPSSLLTPDNFLLASPVQTARCTTNAALPAGGTLTMNVRVYASLTSASRTAPPVNNPTGSHSGLCGESPLASTVRVCASVPAGAIANEGDVRVTDPADLGGSVPSAGVANTAKVLVTQVTPAIALTLNPASATDGPSAYEEFVVTLDRPSDGSITFTFATTDGSGASGAKSTGARIDYNAPPATCTTPGNTTTGTTLTIPAGQQFGLIDVCLNDNNTAGLGTLTFTLTISSPTTTSTVDPTVVMDNGTSSEAATGTISADE